MAREPVKEIDVSWCALAYPEEVVKGSPYSIESHRLGTVVRDKKHAPVPNAQPEFVRSPEALDVASALVSKPL